MTPAYLAHWVRGPAGNEATPDDIAGNMAHALQYAAQIRRLCPSLELYVPAEHESLYQQVFQESIDRDVVAEQILNQCCAIARLCEFILVVNEPSAGMRREIGAVRRGTIVHLWEVPRLNWGEMLSAAGIPILQEQTA